MRSGGRPASHTTNRRLRWQPHHRSAPSDLGKDTAGVGISREKEWEAAKRSGGWRGGPYQSGSHIFNSPTALFQPLPIASSLLRSFLFFFWFPILSIRSIPSRFSYWSILFFRFSILPPLLSLLFYLYISFSLLALPQIRQTFLDGWQFK